MTAPSPEPDPAAAQNAAPKPGYMPPRVPRPPAPPMRAGSGIMMGLYVVGIVLLLLGGMVLFTANNIFVGLLFANLMVIGGCSIIGGAIVMALRPPA